MKLKTSDDAGKRKAHSYILATFKEPVGCRCVVAIFCCGVKQLTNHIKEIHHNRLALTTNLTKVHLYRAQLTNSTKVEISPLKMRARLLIMNNKIQ